MRACVRACVRACGAQVKGREVQQFGPGQFFGEVSLCARIMCRCARPHLKNIYIYLPI